MAYVTALALVLGAQAGRAWAEEVTVSISSTVSSQEQITQAENDADVAAGDTVSYEINVDSGNGVQAGGTTITIGTG